LKDPPPGVVILFRAQKPTRRIHLRLTALGGQ
jgi:hypothetical protein